MNYRICPFCGAHLDPQERCDCNEEAPGGTAIPDRAQEQCSMFCNKSIKEEGECQ